MSRLHYVSDIVNSDYLYTTGYATYQSDFSFEPGVTSFLGVRYANPPLGKYDDPVNDVPTHSL